MVTEAESLPASLGVSMAPGAVWAGSAILGLISKDVVSAAEKEANGKGGEELFLFSEDPVRSIRPRLPPASRCELDRERHNLIWSRTQPRPNRTKAAHARAIARSRRAHRRSSGPCPV